MQKQKERDNRISWDDYFFSIVDLVSQRSVCLKHQIGAVIVKDNQILSTGYNGPASGIEHCITCPILDTPHGVNRNLCPAVHAEMNALVLAAKRGISVDGATLYCSYFPCSLCASCLITAGIAEIVFLHGYTDALNTKILSQSNIKTRFLEV